MLVYSRLEACAGTHSGISQMARMVLIRLALLAACLLVFVPAGHIALPMGVAFLRFVNSQYAAEPADWVILALLAAGIVLSMLSAAGLRDGCLLFRSPRMSG